LRGKVRMSDALFRARLYPMAPTVGFDAKDAAANLLTMQNTIEQLRDLLGDIRARSVTLNDGTVS
jgi:hypothetical protein